MNIGIDIDGVLTDMEEFIINDGTKFCIEEEIPIQIQEICYSEIQTFNWTIEQANRFWDRYFANYVRKTRARAFAREVIEMLKEQGHNIYIITARNEEGLSKEYYGKMQELTKIWLKENNIKYDKLIFSTDEEKKKMCIDNQINIMIEDCPKNILNISEQIPVIKYNCQYNVQTKGENIITAYSWYQIYDIVNKKMKGE